MSWLKKMFSGGGNAAATVEPIEYEGFRIFPEPIPEGGKFRISARIEKDIDGELKTHRLIRADTLDGLQAAQEASLGKAKQMINEQGDRLFS